MDKHALIFDNGERRTTIKELSEENMFSFAQDLDGELHVVSLTRSEMLALVCYFHAEAYDEALRGSVRYMPTPEAEAI
ncbi:hypothetical protein P9E05_14080 [Bacillus mojavensis]|uniref:hypothetical protein n=1 Tax=Bacillus mojavensis TaxID=72360 RepID=UPI002DBA0051|nr:hypothetical protein [Bacillus mojavensis]MEC1692607.1 hypothetical protein [Bacillus mojavensis]